MQDSHPSKTADPLAASAAARRRSTRQWGPGGGMRGKLAQPDRGTGVAARAPRRRVRQPACADHSWVGHRNRRQRGQLRLGRAGRAPPRPLAFAKCMRANGVPNFPDPKPGGGFEFPVSAGNDPASPAFRAAQAKCRKLLPGGGPPGPGSTTHPSAQTLAKLVRIAQCMRQHGDLPVPRPQDLRPVQPGRLPGDHRFRRSDPSVPEHDQPAVAGLQAGLDRVRRAATWPPPLIDRETPGTDYSGVT